MDKSLEQLLESLEDYWRKIDLPLLAKLEPGIDPDGIEPRNFDGVLPQELKALYKWKNGIKPEFATDLIGRLSLFSGGIPMPMPKVWWVQDTMGGAGDLAVGSAGDLGVSGAGDLGWSRTKIPIFESGGGEFFLLDCDVTTPEFGQILFYSPGSIDFDLTISIYDSLITLFQTVLQSYKAGLYQVDDNQMMVVADYPKLHRLEKELNPKSGYWKLFDW